MSEYLEALGVDWLYLSPLLAARRGSTHGYDVVDPTRINRELGSEQDFERLARRLSARGRAILLDIVPNHLAADADNPWWTDVLLRGQASSFAKVFDIDWELGGGKLLLPVLGDELDAVVARDELALERNPGGLWLRYFEHRMPLRDPSGIVPAGDSPHLSHADLKRLLLQQAYELRFFREPRPLNYRRFFTIGDLVGVRVEDEQVFSRTHEKVLSWVHGQLVSGLRVDHPDGLLDPAGYLEHLASTAAAAYVVVEKILSADEALRDDWPVQGTTGYEQLNRVSALFVDRSAEQPLWQLYQRFTGRSHGLKEVVIRSKRLVLESSLAPEVDALARHAREIALERMPHASLDDLRNALIEIVACFEVYRSYVRPAADAVLGEDRRLIEQAIAQARLAPNAPQEAFDAWRSLLLLEPPLAPGGEGSGRARTVLLRFQQLTGPAAAKGVEDTAFYRFHPLASLAEVGGEPDAFGIDLAAFHVHNSIRARRFAHALSASSTHDTKRSEDVRARISVLSEVVETWGAALSEFSALNRPCKTAYGAGLAPDANDEYLLYQTLVGSFPLDGVLRPEYRERIVKYAIKAIRESKRYTRWSKPDQAYERATEKFVLLLLDAERHAFVDRFRAFLTPLVLPGLFGALSQLVVKLGCPGAADFYQGTELWDDSLVDPDNRRPVDFELCRRLLATLDAEARPSELFERIEDGRLKLWVTSRGLRWRRAEPELFTCGEYQGLPVAGPRADQVVAFVRRHGAHAALLACGRFFTRFGVEAPIARAWRDNDVELGSDFSSGHYEDMLTGAAHTLQAGERLPVSELFATLPVAMLRRTS